MLTLVLKKYGKSFSRLLEILMGPYYRGFNGVCFSEITRWNNKICFWQINRFQNPDNTDMYFF